MEISLNQHWTMLDGEKRYPCQVPCSVYDTLLQAGAIPDPYVGENQWDAAAVSDRDFTFETRFDAPAPLLACDQVLLRFDGIDTLAEVLLNGAKLGETDNMHRVWTYDVTDRLNPAGNVLTVAIHSPNRYIAQLQAQRPLTGVSSTTPGYPWLRKAHCMFGWDWGPVLPDMGIWRGVSLVGQTAGAIRGVYYTQRHEAGCVTLACRADLETWREGAEAILTVVSPAGETWRVPLAGGEGSVVIEHPALWWVRGLGEQPLYTCTVTLTHKGQEVDRHARRIGLRTLTVSQEEDAWGREFCFINNGVKVFAMGANYIPEDQILPCMTRARTRRLLEDCKAANYNFIRVWGGGIYPDEDFYDWCDENGLIVWQDFMFACSAYRLTPGFERTVRAEFRDNILRLRNHASLGLWCGNNEIESAWAHWGWPEDPECRSDYLRLFEEIIPGMLRDLDPETFYWPSSPSSGGGFNDPDSAKAGDRHYWSVWHSLKPIEAFRADYYRFCSEYGFESLPDIRTVRAFASEDELDLCGNVMEAHQKCVQGNEKIMFYLAQMVNYPADFERLIYCSQLVQADCIRSNVEHMRRARGRCMGSAYWQVNDSNPVISWSSIDYFGRWKGLHYAARRFYAPLLLSCDDTDPEHPALYVTNDTPAAARLTVRCRLRDHRAAILRAWEEELTVPALSAVSCLKLDLSADLADRRARRSRYLEYTLLRDGAPVSAGTTLFVRPKNFEILPGKVEVKTADLGGCFAVTLCADVYVKSVCLSVEGADCVFSDNWFDLHGAEPVTVTVPKAGELAAWSADALREKLRIQKY